jgi:hypothetical protein
MSLSQKAITDFSSIYAGRYGIDLSDEEAERKAIQLLSLFKLIYRPVSATDKAVLEGFKRA